MKLICALAVTATLSGCFGFIWIPSNEPGNSCVAEVDAKPGAKVRHDDGRMGVVNAVYGRSSRCSGERRPFLVDVSYQ